MQTPLPRKCHLCAQTPQWHRSEEVRALKCILCLETFSLNCTASPLLGFQAVSWQHQAPPAPSPARSPITAASLQVLGHASPAAVPSQAFAVAASSAWTSFVRGHILSRDFPAHSVSNTAGPALARTQFSLLPSLPQQVSPVSCPLLSRELREGRDCCRLYPQCPAQNPM